MLTTQKQLLQQIRQIEGFENANIFKIHLQKHDKIVNIFIMIDKSYLQENVNKVCNILQQFVTSYFQVKLHVQKSVADNKLIVKTILSYMHNHPFLSLFFQEGDIVVENSTNKIICTLLCDQNSYAYLHTNKMTLQEIEGLLAKKYCNAFQLLLQLDKNKKIQFTLEEKETIEEDISPCRTFPIVDFCPIDKMKCPVSATYLADCNFESNALTVCGEILKIQRITSKAGKEYLRLLLDDKTASMSINYFFKKSTQERILELNVGDKIVCLGKNEVFNDSLSFTAQYIAKGSYPHDFLPQQKEGRAVPSSYQKINPEKITDYNQIDFFIKQSFPAEFLNNTFVVFDLETTGLINDPITGKMDCITEIGAVKICNGEIKEKFSTLINPKRKLDAKIIAITGITDAMLIGQPEIQDVIADFYKFCHGSILVGHNVIFDYKFIKYYGEQSGFHFIPKYYDTVTLARERLSLSNYKLNTVAAHFNIQFQHHRAYDDALTTAKIFIELIKMKNTLPPLPSF